MKLIYFSILSSHNDYALSDDAPGYSSSGLYYFTDILGVIFHLPITNTFLWYKEFDGDEKNIPEIPERYKKALAEMKGKESGVAKITKR